MSDKPKIPRKPQTVPKAPPPKAPPSPAPVPSTPDVIKDIPERGPLIPPRKR